MSARILEADRRADAALRAVDDDDPRSQLASLEALQALVDACRAEGAAVLAREAARFLDERKRLTRSFHRGRVEREGTPEAIEAARLVLGALDGAVPAEPPREKPRPFFARFLEHQKR